MTGISLLDHVRARVFSLLTALLCGLGAATGCSRPEERSAPLPEVAAPAASAASAAREPGPIPDLSRVLAAGVSEGASGAEEEPVEPPVPAVGAMPSPSPKGAEPAPEARGGASAALASVARATADPVVTSLDSPGGEADRGAGAIPTTAGEGAFSPRGAPATRSPEKKEDAAADRGRPDGSPGKEPLRSFDGTADLTRRDYDANCLRSGCHGGYKEQKHVHGPILVDACDKCHEAVADGGPHEFRLVRPAEELCTACHVPPTAKKFAHQPFTEGKCLECHDPHGGPLKSLLSVGRTADACGKCHEKHPGEFLHGPYAVGECDLCHEPHQSDHERLLVLPNKELCVKCHTDIGALLATSPFDHGPANVDCSACHLPHGASNQKLLRKETKALCTGCHDSVTEKMATDPVIHGAMESEAGCTGCHTPHASQFKSQLRAVTSDLCLGCHDRELVNPRTGHKTPDMSRIVAARFKHGPVETGDCQSCHFPHSAQYPNLLHKAFPSEFYAKFRLDDYALCFTCHEPTLVLEEFTTSLTGFRDGNRNLHFVHVNREKGRTCRVCHDVHASDLPKHMRESVPFGAGDWELPINFVKTESGGTCSPGCHKPQSYDNASRAPRVGAIEPAMGSR